MADGDPLGGKLCQRFDRSSAAENVEGVVDHRPGGVAGFFDDLGRRLDGVDVVDEAQVFHRRLDADPQADFQELAIVSRPLVVVGLAAGGSGNDVDRSQLGRYVHPPFALLQRAGMLRSGRFKPALEINRRRQGEALVGERLS